MLAVLCTQEGVFCLCEEEVFVGYNVFQEGVFHVCEGMVCWL